MDYIILALATFRISSLLVNETGPFGIFARLRRAAGVTVNEYSQEVGEGFLGELFTCVWCMSVWVGSGLALAYYLLPAVIFWLCLPLALSTVAIFINCFTAK